MLASTYLADNAFLWLHIATNTFLPAVDSYTGNFLCQL